MSSHVRALAQTRIPELFPPTTLCARLAILAIIAIMRTWTDEFVDETNAIADEYEIICDEAVARSPVNHSKACRTALLSMSHASDPRLAYTSTSISPPESLQTYCSQDSPFTSVVHPSNPGGLAQAAPLSSQEEGWLLRQFSAEVDRLGNNDEPLASYGFAATVICSCYEMLDAPASDWQRHLDGVFSFSKLRRVNGSSGGIEQAGFWSTARQDVVCSIMHRSKLRLDPDLWAIDLEHIGQEGTSSWQMFHLAQILLLTSCPTQDRSCMIAFRTIETDMWHSPKQARRKLSGKLRSAHLLCDNEERKAAIMLLEEIEDNLGWAAKYRAWDLRRLCTDI
ncbi:hypothetical protein BDV37DRAFT_272531 [Aspergillus pseudonomiae]|uniref:Fungal-specific transcription factor domain-containing protein n=1 Tax=Aspergillus pseudonomiae TaxID=1506151 RepID=A0A5N7D8P1_9EURO|nr:uncharacterized protein BDV37DRAFT_272531 [Aspergillus pseudonomiae]KAE8402812.1 hypothetical protein BDV37DRAFT_272531 [Aspergillus pseudonomiae]